MANGGIIGSVNDPVTGTISSDVQTFTSSGPYTAPSIPSVFEPYRVGTVAVVAGGADISATNGTVHIVDAVIGLPTVVDFALANPALSNLVAALQLADSQNPSPDLIPTLQGAGPFTVFAPTDAAFASLLLELDPSGTTELGDLDPALVQSVLTYHVVSGNVTSSQLTTGPVTTLGGTIDANATNFTLTDPNDRVSNIITTLVNIQAANGVVHAIDKVILPPL